MKTEQIPLTGCPESKRTEVRAFATGLTKALALPLKIKAEMAHVTEAKSKLETEIAQLKDVEFDDKKTVQERSILQAQVNLADQRFADLESQLESSWSQLNLVREAPSLIQSATSADLTAVRNEIAEDLAKHFPAPGRAFQIAGETETYSRYLYVLRAEYALLDDRETAARYTLPILESIANGVRPTRTH